MGTRWVKTEPSLVYSASAKMVAPGSSPDLPAFGLSRSNGAPERVIPNFQSSRQSGAQSSTRNYAQ